MKTYIFTIVLLSLLIASTVCGQSEDLQLLGRIYDTDQVNKCIDNADLIIIVSGRPPDDLDYPKSNGRYEALAFGRGIQKNVKIKAVHPDYAQAEKLEYTTTTYKEVRNVRMKYKPAMAELNYRNARKLIVSPSLSKSDLLKSFELMQEAITLSPKSRYYIFQADNIGRYVKSSESGRQLPYQLINFAKFAPEDEYVSTLSKKEQYDIYLKLGHGFSQAKDLHSLADGQQPFIIFAINAYNKAIKIRPEYAIAYQGKYLTQKKAGNYFDAIETIKNYFDEHDPIKSELTIKGFLVDWVDLVMVATNYKTDEVEMERIRNTSKHIEAWQALTKRLDQYNEYFSSDEIRGNKNLKEARRIGRIIVENN